jgi:16S rRNA (cytosine967-C5)-methyltransferase
VTSDRQRAVALLRRIDRDAAFASPLLHEETGFVRTMVLGVLRWRSRLDHAIAQFAKRKIDPLLLDVLRLGAYQLLFMDVAQYAAVGETVALAPTHARGFANAVLRRIAEGKAVVPRDLATRTAHPAWLTERWTRAYGAERAARIAEANQELSYPDVFTDTPPAGAEPSSLVPGIWKLKHSSAGVDGYALDEGSALIATIAAATSRDVLDLAAAPGGKSIVMQARGASVVSNDISLTRLRPLFGRSRKIVVGDGLRPPFRRRFETVLLDAPCSATGTIRKSPELKWRLKESDIASFALLQTRLLQSALALAAQYVVYSTCSLEREENDDVLTTAGSDWERVDLTQWVPEGARGWVEDGVLRLTPDSGADGFTAFVLQRKSVI